MKFEALDPSMIQILGESDLYIPCTPLHGKAQISNFPELFHAQDNREEKEQVENNSNAADLKKKNDVASEKPDKSSVPLTDKGNAKPKKNDVASEKPDKSTVPLTDKGNAKPKKGSLNAHRVKSLMELYNITDGFDHLAVHRRLNYFHHFILKGWMDKEKKVIEYSSCFLCSVTGVGEVVERSFHEEEMIRSIKEGNLYVIKGPNYPKTDEEKTNATQRYLERLGEKSYGLAYNNCEHLVSYIMKGIPNSEQIKEAGIWRMFIADVLQTLLIDFKKNTLIVGSYLLSKSVFVLTEKAIELTSTVLALPLLLEYRSSNVHESTTFFVLGALDGSFGAMKLIDLNYLKGKNHISEEDYKLETRKTVYESLARGGTGVIGEVFCPIPGVGYTVGSMIGNIGGRLLGSSSFASLCPFPGTKHD